MTPVSAESGVPDDFGAVSCWAPDGVPEVVGGDDLAALFAQTGTVLQAGDILVVSSKVVSKAEGRHVVAEDREQAISDQTVRVVATRHHPTGGTTRIVENHLGIVGAAAGVDASNVADGIVLLLPVDPDASAAVLCETLRADFGVPVGVVISDTLGRPWRVGQTDVAIGSAGVTVVDDLRGHLDAGGRQMDATIIAVADEIAALADLVKGKVANRPFAVVRGLSRYVAQLDTPAARSLVRAGGPDDMFLLGSDEAYDDGYRDGYATARDESPHTGRSVTATQ